MSYLIHALVIFCLSLSFGPLSAKESQSKQTVSHDKTGSRKKPPQPFPENDETALPDYGELYTKSVQTQTLPPGSAVVPLTTFDSEGLSFNIHVSGQQMVINCPGIYEVDFSASASVANNGRRISFFIFVNNVLQEHLKTTAVNVNSGEPSHFGVSGLLNLNKGDVLRVYASQDGGTTLLTVACANFHVKRIK